MMELAFFSCRCFSSTCFSTSFNTSSFDFGGEKNVNLSVEIRKSHQTFYRKKSQVPKENKVIN